MSRDVSSQKMAETLFMRQQQSSYKYALSDISSTLLASWFTDG